MFTLMRCIRSDFQKFRHTSILWIHILIPLAVAALFIAYYSVSPWSTAMKLSGYFEMIGISLPMGIGLVCGKAIEQEGQAGNFQTILCGIKSRTAMYISKFIVVFLLGILSISLAVGVFAAGFQGGTLVLYMKAAGLLLVGSAFLYLFHLFLSFRYGKGVSAGLGIVESLISALSLTGLGDGKWYYIPCAWSARFCDILVSGRIYSQTDMAFQEIVKCLFIAAPATVAAFLFSLLWFQKWEGRNFYE